jgi:thiamine-phosphate pyrophosphorylase
LLQVRAKDLASGDLLRLCEGVTALAARAEALVIVNDRADLARLSGAAGVHLGQEDLPVGAAQTLLGPGAIIGLSTHDEMQIVEGGASAATYLAVGPVFDTATKDTGREAVGLNLVTAAADRGGGKPVVAIGGITLERAPAILAAGAASVAVIADLLADGDPAGRVRAYRRVLGG